MTRARTIPLTAAPHIPRGVGSGLQDPCKGRAAKRHDSIYVCPAKGKRVPNSQSYAWPSPPMETEG